MTPEDQTWIDTEYAPKMRKVWSDRNPNQPILDFLDEPCRIIRVIGLTSDRREIVIEEACDGYFGLTFNKAQFSELIEALQVLRDQMSA